MSHETNPALDPVSATQTVVGTPWDVVHHITNFYDFPLEGLADFDGKPVMFFLHDEVSRPDPEDPDDYYIETVYALYPTTEELVSDLTEKSEIFERWHQAYAQDRTLMDSHPALPAERARHDELKAKLAPQLDALRQSPAPFVKVGKFAGNRRPVAVGGSRWKGFEVQWSAAS